MKLLYFLIVITIIATFYPVLKYNREWGYEGFENEMPPITDPREQYKLTIDLIDEFKRLRFLLDKYDNEAIKYPADSDLAKRRTALEHMLTKIVVYIQRNGHKISVSDAKSLLL
jgi:hypothetical protein